MRDFRSCRSYGRCVRDALISVVCIAIPLFLIADDWTVGTGGKPARHSQSEEYGPADPDILWQGGLSAVIAQQGGPAEEVQAGGGG